MVGPLFSFLARFPLQRLSILRPRKGDYTPAPRPPPRVFLFQRFPFFLVGRLLPRGLSPPDNLWFVTSSVELPVVILLGHFFCRFWKLP